MVVDEDQAVWIGCRVVKDENEISNSHVIFQYADFDHSRRSIMNELDSFLTNVLNLLPAALVGRTSRWNT